MYVWYVCICACCVTDPTFFNEVVEVPAGGDLMKCAKPVTACGNQFEGIPNRDSIKYRSVYNIPSVETLLRGSLRYQVRLNMTCTTWAISGGPTSLSVCRGMLMCFMACNS